MDQLHSGQMRHVVLTHLPQEGHLFCGILIQEGLAGPGNGMSTSGGLSGSCPERRRPLENIRDPAQLHTSFFCDAEHCPMPASVNTAWPLAPTHARATQGADHRWREQKMGQVNRVAAARNMTEAPWSRRQERRLWS